MSLMETVALAIVAGLLGGVVGALWTAAVITQGQRRTEARLRRLDASARWLAARLSLTRASRSVVAAFRSLAAERRDATYFALRREEAQRARSQWCDAMRELDSAEAALIAYSPNDFPHNPANRFPRVDAAALRRAINGDETDVQRLMHALRSADQRAIGFVRAGASGPVASRSRLRERMTLAARRFESMVEQWSLRAARDGKNRNPVRRAGRR